MPITPKNDNESIDIVLNELFKEAIPYWLNAPSIRYLFDDSYYYNVDRILRKMYKLDLINRMKIDIELFRPSHENFRISDHAIEILNEYGSYSNYVNANLLSKRKDEKKVVFDRIITNGNVIAALLISALSLILTQCPRGSSKEQQKIEQGLESVAKELDSLKQVLHNSQEHPQKQPTLDTATSK